MKWRTSVSSFILGILGLGCFFAFVKFGWIGGVPPQPDIFLQPPTLLHWFGTDSLGRDLFWRTFLGGFYSLSIGLAAATLSLLWSLFFLVLFEIIYPKFGALFLRILDVIQSNPNFIIVTLLCIIFPGSNFMKVIFAISFVSWMSPFRLLRGYVHQMMKEDFIDASRSLGASQWDIAKKHLPLYLKDVLKNSWLGLVPHAIVLESTLSFVGLGLQSPQTSWGLLVQEGWRTMAVHPHLVFLPVFFLALTSLCLQNLLYSPRP